MSCGANIMLAKPTGRVGSSSRVSAERLEVVARRGRCRRGLVGDAPHHDAGVVLVAGHQFAEVLRVGRLRVRVGVCSEKVGSAAAPKIPPTTPMLSPTAAVSSITTMPVPVGELEHLFGVGIVGGAERVRADPLHELEVVDHERVIVALAAHRGVFVLAEPCEVERLTVDEELVPAHLDGADADGDRVAVHHRSPCTSFHRQLVEVGRAGPPRITSGTVRVPAAPSPRDLRADASAARPAPQSAAAATRYSTCPVRRRTR